MRANKRSERPSGPFKTRLSATRKALEERSKRREPGRTECFFSFFTKRYLQEARTSLFSCFDKVNLRPAARFVSKDNIEDGPHDATETDWRCLRMWNNKNRQMSKEI